MTLAVGPKLAILVHGAPGDEHYDALMKQWRALDLLIQPTAKSKTTTTPPGSPADGDTYIIPASATGAWFDHDTEIARWSAVESLWEFFVPNKNWIFGVDDASSGSEMQRFNGTAWVDLV